MYSFQESSFGHFWAILWLIKKNLSNCLLSEPAAFLARVLLVPPARPRARVLAEGPAARRREQAVVPRGRDRRHGAQRASVRLQN